MLQKVFIIYKIITQSGHILHNNDFSAYWLTFVLPLPATQEVTISEILSKVVQSNRFIHTGLNRNIAKYITFKSNIKIHN